MCAFSHAAAAGCLRVLQEQKQEQTRKLMQTLDADGDGELSFKEFEAWFRYMLTRSIPLDYISDEIALWQ